MFVSGGEGRPGRNSTGLGELGTLALSREQGILIQAHGLCPVLMMVRESQLR